MGKYNNKLLASIFPIFLMGAMLLCINADVEIGVLYTLIISVAVMVAFFIITFAIPLINYKNTTNEITKHDVNKLEDLIAQAQEENPNVDIDEIVQEFAKENGFNEKELNDMLS